MRANIIEFLYFLIKVLLLILDYKPMKILSLQDRITLEAGKRSGKPCIRGLRITVSDVLAWLAIGMNTQEILEDFPELEAEDIKACLQFAAQREHNMQVLIAA